MAIINQFDKRSGITYVYESTSYWDKEKQQPRAKRKLIGKRDPATGEIIPTDGRGKKRKEQLEPLQPAKPGPVPIDRTSRRFYGATYLLDEIGNTLGLSQDLKQCFPTIHKQIQSIAYYLILESDSPLFRFERWSSLHKHPYGGNIPSQRSSEIFSSISEEMKSSFFKLQEKRRHEDEYWAYDTTSVSSYSQTLCQVQYGKNKEHDRLPQINLALVFGQKSGLPFYYRKLAGNIPDVSTLKNLLADFEALGFEKVKLIMDRGFYSEANINGLFKERLKFIVAVQTGISFVRREIDKVYDTIRSYDNLDEQHGLYSTTVLTEWDYRQERPYKKDVIAEKRRIYLHVYFNIDKYADDETSFDRKLLSMRKELQDGKHTPEHESFYKKYFEIKETPVRGMQVTVKEDAVRKSKRYYGYFTLMSNEKMDAMTALQLYRNKDLIEKAFGNIKDRLNLRRLLVSSERSLDGKLFVSFVALIYVSYIKNHMQETGLFKDYTVQSLLDKLDLIECFENPGHALRVGEVLSKQKQIYEALAITPPA
ncbi:IS1634 family transposase [Anaerotalea alkaliphila]|uniref:IS1634 family transposase n=1 Tax=Anaerotalea alkaliphila TaxID=2662126 RepID=A0A7X5HYA4_9FIRM|nr:IS1634 family transposase [Anaerotalea alkaliphila]NDL68874.1 IS1634 family transposase [Anaerotalea alkaliphila]